MFSKLRSAAIWVAMVLPFALVAAALFTSPAGAATSIGQPVRTVYWAAGSCRYGAQDRVGAGVTMTVLRDSCRRGMQAAGRCQPTHLWRHGNSVAYRGDKSVARCPWPAMAVSPYGVEYVHVIHELAYVAGVPVWRAVPVWSFKQFGTDF